MTLLLSHLSALEYWRSHGKGSRDEAQLDPAALSQMKEGGIRAPFSPPNEAALSHTGLQTISHPLEVTVGIRGARRTSTFFKQHVYSGLLPLTGVVSIGDGVCISSPELSFMQMAETLSAIKLIQLGLELCGSYSLFNPTTQAWTQPGTNTDKGFYNRPPLTSVEEISTLLAQMTGARGQRKASWAMRYIADGSASPMETILVMLLTLPYRLGGYAFAMPELNYRIDMEGLLRQSASKYHFFCDLYWPEAKVAAEYDSNAHHLGTDQLANDAGRRNSLQTAGISVISVTSRDIYQVVEFDKIARLLALNLDRRLRHDENLGFVDKRAQLRAMLLRGAAPGH